MKIELQPIGAILHIQHTPQLVKGHSAADDSIISQFARPTRFAERAIVVESRGAAKIITHHLIVLRLPQAVIVNRAAAAYANPAV